LYQGDSGAVSLGNWGFVGMGLSRASVDVGGCRAVVNGVHVCTVYI
jgi:hypothetical protein